VAQVVKPLHSKHEKLSLSPNNANKEETHTHTERERERERETLPRPMLSLHIVTSTVSWGYFSSFSTSKFFCTIILWL
jgi:hypothetical protein